MQAVKVAKMFSKCCGQTTFRPSMLLAFFFSIITLAIPAGGPADAVSTTNGAAQAANDVPPVVHAGEGWQAMPAGGRPAYIGIHGGTVPVSLLTTRGGATMVALVGETGSDFLRVLRGGNASSKAEEVPQPHLVASAASATDARPMPAKGEPGPMPIETVAAPMPNATMLVASTSSGNIPVIYAAGRSFERMDIAPSEWTPFGLGDETVKNDGSGHNTPKIKAKKAKAKQKKTAVRKPAQTRQASKNPQHKVLHNEGGPVSITTPLVLINA